MELRNIIFILYFIASVAFFARNASRLLSYLKVAKPDVRWDRIPERISQMISVSFLQKKILRDKAAGPIHAGIFWGFLVLMASALEAVVEGFHEGWSLNFLGPIYSAITILTDIVCLVIIVAIIAAFYRRFVARVKRLQGNPAKQRDALIVLGTILTIVSSLLISNASRRAMGHDFSWAVRPIAGPLANIISPDAAPILFEITWWIHAIAILAFLNYLPFSKHLHVLTSIPNTFFATIGPSNKLKPINFEEEGVEKFGVEDIEDFTWKTIHDSYTCTNCGRCTSVCPANITGKILDPRHVIMQVRERTMDRAPWLIAQNGKLVSDGADETDHALMGTDAISADEDNAAVKRTLIGDYIPVEALWQCTTCAACMQECPVMIEHVPAIVDMRRSLVLMKSEFPPEVMPAFSNMENNFTPWAFSSSERADWAEGTGIKTVAEDPEMEVLFWVGCAGSYDDRAKKITRSFGELMQIAGVNFRILGTEEKCTGDPARRMGNEYLADMLIKMNVETLNGYSVKKIVTTCPHCLNTFKNEYPMFGGNFEVHHHTQFIQDMIKSGRLVVPKEGVSKATVAYHDSCYLGRYNNEYEAPRATLTNIPGLEILEVARSGDKGFCCGAGGGRMFMEETEGKRVNVERTEELVATNANTIALNCPFCMTMITDGVKEMDKIDSVRVLDVSEILLEQVKAGRMN